MDGRKQNHAHARLVASLLPESVAKTWAVAQYEWELDRIEVHRDVDGDGNVVDYARHDCRCGHEDIVELCFIKNQSNGNEAIVGNVCVKKFFGIDSTALLKGIKRIQRNIKAAPCRDIIHYAWERKMIESEADLALFQRTARVNFVNLNERQAGKRIAFNRMMLAHFVVKEKAAAA